MSFDDGFTTTNYPRHQAREIHNTIRSMSFERKETLVARILFQKPLMDRNIELADHLVSLLQGKHPRASLEMLLRDSKPASLQFLVVGADL